ncbi:MAG TPA: nitric-oxide reductase large subunit [Acidobacteria bacterium]|nr:nitric-oxide reductase large subunit [Acidobacteriota bacterium]
MSYRKYFWAFGLVIVLSFAVLGGFGFEIYQKAPPRPEQIVSASGEVLYTHQDLLDGQNVWQSMGGQQVGSIWGHGAYVAPDWSADWLHREAIAMLDLLARQNYGRDFETLGPGEQAAVKAAVQAEMRHNGYDADRDVLVISDLRARAVTEVAAHYDALFSDDPSQTELREAYAIPPGSVPDPERRHKLTAFFFWASWTCAAERPGEAVSYTNNWPAEPLVGNHPSASIVGWSLISILVLILGIGALAWHFARKGGEEDNPDAPTKDPFLGLQPTPSMKATYKYFWTVGLLAVVQVLLGIIAAHYGVEGDGFYGFDIQSFLPYSVVRTWHTQAGIFWIATAWLATGLFIAPAIGGREPKGQRFLVNFLYVCILTIVGGSMLGEWLGIHQKLGYAGNFWFGHQGYEYVDLGRFWQLFLFVGLLIWFTLVVRALAPAFREKEGRPLLGLFTIAAGAIGLFYGAGLMWGQHTHLSIAEYWRWWVVHLWVEGFFEVFATVAIAFLFSRMGLIRARTATAAAFFTSTIYLTGGIIGTMHHLYFTGTPTGVMALGATFSALEIVPLVFVGFEAMSNLRLSTSRPWVTHYRWPIYFFVAVSFWNLVGAGVFGFLINPPIALYYVQGLNTTPVHGHSALFGVYGMLGFGLLLFSLRAMTIRYVWKEKLLSIAFWSLNIGLAAMVLLSLLPIGLLQTWASITHGMWFARSAEFMQTGLMDNLRWMRVFGDVIFSVGIVAMAWFITGIATGSSFAGELAGKSDAPDGRKASSRA